MMKKFIFPFVLCLISFKGLAQVDFVYDSKTLKAMKKEWAVKGKRINAWMKDEAKIAKEQKEIARKVAFIEFVRDSLYKSLQDVNGITDGKDMKLVNKLCYDIEVYQLKLDSIAKKHPQFNPFVKECKEKLVGRANQLRFITDMAILGQDTTNLINKEQRLSLLDYVIKELRGIRHANAVNFNVLQIAQKAEYIDKKQYNTNKK